MTVVFQYGKVLGVLPPAILGAMPWKNRRNEPSVQEACKPTPPKFRGDVSPPKFRGRASKKHCNRVHAKGVVLSARTFKIFCLLSAFYKTLPSKNPSKNLVSTENPSTGAFLD